MRIIDYHYIHGTEDRTNYIAIPEMDRNKAANKQFINLADLNITLDKPTAFLYVDGVSLSPSESGLNPVDIKNYLPRIKATSAYCVHEWVHTFKNKEFLVYVNTISGTCAAGIQALYEAEKLLKTREVKEVIIIGGERITEDTLRLFHELQIPIICGDGFFYMKVTNSNTDGKHPHVDDIKWKYSYQSNPFMFTRDTLDTLRPTYTVDFVKLHGTGTKANTEAEEGLSKIGIPITYKEKLGHTQGVSSLLETCLVLDDPFIIGNILITANGLGGFYGAFTLIK